MNFMMMIWLIGITVSIIFFIISIVKYKNGEGTKTPIILSGIISFVLATPIFYLAWLIIGLSTGIISM